MVKDEEIEILLNDVYEKYGYDFSEYSRASLKRRIDRICELDKFPSFAELRYRIKSDQSYLTRFVEEITVNVTEMFRDPLYYKFLRSTIIPSFKHKPFIRIWHAGCSTGEEVYSMAILLKEAGILDKSLLYATDLSPEVLEKARSGKFSISQMKSYSLNYIHSGGKEDFSSYYSANYGYAKFAQEFSKKIIFSTHNLVSDGSFNAFDIIVCRNVLIYFNKDLQERVFKLFDESLEISGYLNLGTKETLQFSSIIKKYQQEGKEKIWKKIS